MQPTQIAVFCLGILLVIMGSLLIQRKRLRIPIGRPRPVFSITLSGIGAVIFGTSGILCGLAVIGFVVFSLTPTGNGSWANSNLVLQILILGGLALGFGVGLIMQILMFLIDATRKRD